MDFDIEDCQQEYNELSKDLRYFSQKKRVYLDKEHREMDIQDDDGQVVTKAAVATGINFFQAQKAKDAGNKVDLERIAEKNELMATTLVKGMK